MAAATSVCGMCGYRWPTGTDGNHSCAGYLRAALDRVKPQPILNAPKDENGILAYGPKFYQGKGGWVAAVWMKDGWHSNPGGWRFEPTHFLPMPAKPSD